MNFLARCLAVGLSFAIACPQTLATELPAPGAVSVDNGAFVEANSMPSLLPVPGISLLKPKPITLQEAILLALRNNPSVESSELQRVVDKFSLEVAHNAFVPQFTIGGSANYANRTFPSYAIGPSMSITTPIGTKVSATYGSAFTGAPGNTTLTITQPLLKGAGWDFNTFDFANANDNEIIAKLSFKNSIITAVVNVITSYRALVQDYNSLDIQSRTVKSAEETAKQTELQVNAGKVAPNDLLQQQANLQTTRLSMMQQNSALDMDYQRFLQALGLSSTSKLEIDKQIRFTEYPIPTLKECIRLALLNNIDYQSTIIRLRAAKRAVLAAKNQARWQIDVTASTSVGQSTGTATIPASTSPTGTPGAVSTGGTGPSIGFTFNIPLNDMQAKQQIISSRIALEQAKLALEQQKEQLISNVTNQVVQIHNQVQQIQVAISAVSLQEKTVSNAELKLKYGKATVFEVTQLQDQLLQQQTSLIGNKIQLLNSITDLDQTLGTALEKWGIKLRY